MRTSGVWHCVVDAQNVVHSVWGNSLEADARKRVDELTHAYGWTGIRVVRVVGEKPSVGHSLRKKGGAS